MVSADLSTQITTVVPHLPLTGGDMSFRKRRSMIKWHRDINTIPISMVSAMLEDMLSEK